MQRNFDKTLMLVVTQIGGNVKIANSIIMDHVVIQDG